MHAGSRHKSPNTSPCCTGSAYEWQLTVIIQMTGAEVSDRNRGAKIGRVWEKVWTKKRGGIWRTETKWADTGNHKASPSSVCRFSLFMSIILKVHSCACMCVCECVCRVCVHSPLMAAGGEETKPFEPPHEQAFEMGLWFIFKLFLSLLFPSVLFCPSHLLVSCHTVSISLRVSLSVGWQPEVVNKLEWLF